MIHFLVGNINTRFNKDSPLAYHMAPGDIISKLDDLSLSSTNDISENLWKQYLFSSQPTPGTFEKGWCIEELYFDSEYTL